MPSYAPPETVAEAVLARLADQSAVAWRLEAAPRLRHLPWSTLYFLTAIDPDGNRRELVVKIVHFPDQQTAEVSWQSEELLLRGRREFESMVRVAEHFARSPDPSLRAVRPRFYVPEINAIVMDFADGVPLYDGYVALRHLWTRQGRQRAAHALRRAGQWLRWLHRLPADDAPPDRVFGPADTVQALLNEVERLRVLGVDPSGLPGWERALAILQQLTDDERVWTHGDFHLRNTLILPGEGILGFDTALERVDSPYFDLGKLVADLQARRARILRWGLLPPAHVTQALARAFLDGYFAGAPPALLPLALYEGRFLFQKWGESLTLIQTAFSGKTAPLAWGIQKVIVNPTFHRLIAHWLQVVTTTTRR